MKISGQGAAITSLFAPLVMAVASVAPVASAPAAQVAERPPAPAKALPATTSDPNDFYYYNGRPVRLNRSRTETVVRLKTAGPARSVVLDLPPSASLRREVRSEGRAFRVVTGLAPFDGDALRARDDLDFVAPVFYHPETGTRMLPTDEIVVKLAAGATPEELARLAAPLELTMVEPMWGTTDEFVLRLHQPKAADTLQKSRALYESGRLAWAEPDFIQEMKKLAVPNDPRFGQQWHLDNTGQSGGIAGADVKAPAAWNLNQGSPAITIAVIDDGVQKTHEDLAGSIFTNPGEIVNGVDDDGNGKVDDVNGWDFNNNDNDASPMDPDDNHGTAVAGVAAARGNNALGVSGSCQGCRILPIKIFSPGFAGDAAAANAIRYASTLADVLNNSWGGGAPSAVIQSAIQFANTNGRGGKGSVVLFATGNSASGYGTFTITDFPAGTHRFRWEYSKDVDIVAGEDSAWLGWVQFPGGEIVSFQDGMPAGWTSGGSAPWTAVTDPSHSDEGVCFTTAAKAGAIGDNQTTFLQVIKTLPAGTMVAYRWVSSEAGFDGLRTRIDLFNNGSFDFEGGLESGEPPIQFSVGYPAAHPESIAVGASTNFDCRAPYSQFGPELDFVAPSGGGPLLNLAIETTDRMGAAGYDPGNYTQAAGPSGFSGTSSATPLAAGIAGLILSRNPTLSRAQVLQTMQNTADKVGPQPYVGERNDRYGFGRLNAFNALSSVAGVPIVTTGAATGVGLFGATLNGSVNPNGGTASTAFEYGTTAGYGNTVPAQNVSGPQAISAFVAGLACGTTYHFRAVAGNAVGTTVGGDLTFATNPCPPSVTTQAATNVGRTGATLNGLVNPKGLSTTSAFQYGLTTAYGSMVAAQTLGGSLPQAISASISGLTCGGITYHFRAVATNGSGSTVGGNLTFTTVVCPATVTTQPATGVDQGGATLNGTVNPNGAPATTAFQYGTSAGYGYSIAAQPLTGSTPQAISAALSGLACGTTYHFRAVATNAGGTTPGANAIFATTACPPSPAVDFYTLSPCRVFDTRSAGGPTAGAPLTCGTDHEFTIAGACGVPPSAKAVSLNVTVTAPSAVGNLRLFAPGPPAPLASTVNYAAGQTRGNNAVTPLGAAGSIAARCGPSGTAHMIVDVNGYFE